MADGRYIAYYRVSTAQQGRSGLGLEAQRQAVADWLNGGNWRLLGEHTEVESGKHANRPVLLEALHQCRITGSTLVIAKLDRLSRDAHFLLGLQKAGVEFVAVDMPSANRATISIMAVIADEERRMISARTKAALAAAKARGVKLGGVRPNHVTPDPAVARVAAVAAADAFAADIGPLVTQLRGEGLSLRQIVAELERRGIRTRCDRTWAPTQVKKLLERHAATLSAAHR
jgi:DNA invertase Pin-like site-specific DNA recombinase